MVVKWITQMLPTPCYTVAMDQPHHRHQHIVILGAGFGGLAAALELERRRQPADRYNVTLIDKNCYHLYHALLYEVATAAMDIRAEDIAALQSGVCIRVKALSNILLQKNVQSVQGTVTHINLEQQQVELLNDSPVHYDQLIIALGSETKYFDIPGLAEHSLSLKELPDALNIHVRIDQVLQQVMTAHQPARIVVGGGGVSGVEIAGELKHYANLLSRRHHFDRPLMNVTMIEAGPTVLAGLDSWAKRQATRRLEQLGVQLCLGQAITRVDAQQLTLQDGRQYPFDLLIWCGGIQAHHLLRSLPISLAGKSQAVVDEYLRVPGHPEVVVIGDGAYVLDPATQRPVPQVAPLAVAEGLAVARNLHRVQHGQPLVPFQLIHRGYAIPIGGMWAISTIGGRSTGWLGWLMRKREDWRYFRSILTWADAWRVFFQGGKVYLKNT